MSRTVRLTAAAEADLQDAVDWYRSEADDLSALFRLRFEETVERIRERPEAYPLVIPGVRRAIVHRFPYSVFFRPDCLEVVVVAVIHQARDPRLWRQRVL